MVITAAPATGYHLDYWSGDTNGASISNNMITVPMDGPRTITAFFAIDIHTLSVSSEYGGADPAVGLYTNDYGTAFTGIVTNSPIVNGTTQYACVGWAGTGSVTASGTGTNTGPFALTNDTTLVWQWQTNYFLDTGVNGSGSVDIVDGWVEQGSNVVITATGAQYYHLDYWSGDTNGASISNNMITVPMDGPRTITAFFAENMATNDTPEWWLDSHYPGTNDFNNASLSDTDGDGMAAWQEFRAGTDPTNVFSLFEIVNVQSDPSGHMVYWSSVTDRLYAVYKSTNLLASWTNPPVTNNVSGDSSGTNIYIDMGTIDERAYYRIKVW